MRFSGLTRRWCMRGGKTVPRWLRSFWHKEVSTCFPSDVEEMLDGRGGLSRKVGSEQENPSVDVGGCVTFRFTGRLSPAIPSPSSLRYSSPLHRELSYCTWSVPYSPARHFHCYHR